MTKRRSQGDGGIHWDASKQRWIAAVYIGYRPNGSRRRITASDPTKTGAKEKLRVKLSEAQDAAALAAKGFTVEQAVTDWFDNANHTKGSTTIKNLRSLSNKHIVPELGPRKLQQLTADEVDEWLAERAKVLGTDALRRLHSIMRRSITRAQAREKVGRNVVELCEIPKGIDGRPSKSMTMQQAEALLAAAEETSMRAYIVVSLLTGVRTEEVRALTWDHVDLEGFPTADPPVPPSIQVWRSVRVGNDTKTTKSRRTLELPKRCVEALADHAIRQDVRRRAAGKRWQHHNLVFTSQIGTELNDANVRRSFRKVAAAAKLPAKDWVPRELRHTFVSLLSSKGVSIEEIAALVGHSSTVVTQKVYRHELRPIIQSGAAKMNEVFPGAKEDSEP